MAGYFRNALYIIMYPEDRNKTFLQNRLYNNLHEKFKLLDFKLSP